MDGPETQSPSALETLIPQKPTDIQFSEGHMQELVRNINIRRAIERTRDEILGGENSKGFSVSAELLEKIESNLPDSDKRALIEVIGKEASQTHVDAIVAAYAKMVDTYSPDGPFDLETINNQDSLVLGMFKQQLALRELPDHMLPPGFKDKDNDLEPHAVAFQQVRARAKGKGIQLNTQFGEQPQ